MFIPPLFREERLEVLHALLRAHPLGTLVTHGEEGLRADLTPFLLAEDGGKGVLRAHLSRAHDQLAALRAGGEALVLFQGPQAYVTPSWYTSKAVDGKVAPTWNYVAVEVRGTPRLVEDRDWLRAQLDALTALQEASRAAPWGLGDAPPSFVEAQLAKIVGLEIPIRAITGKWKVSQNRTEADRQGVAQGLRHDRADEAMARLVEGEREGAPSKNDHPLKAIN